MAYIFVGIIFSILRRCNGRDRYFDEPVIARNNAHGQNETTDVKFCVPRVSSGQATVVERTADENNRLEYVRAARG